MGSFFSSPAAAGDGSHLVPKKRRSARERFGRSISKEEMVASLDQGHDGRTYTIEELYAECICWLVQGVLKHYNANNPGAEFQYPTTAMKAACTGFTEGFIWYHLSFSARRRTDNRQEMHLFFAELCYDIDSQKISLETCTILGRKALQKQLCILSGGVRDYAPKRKRICVWKGRATSRILPPGTYATVAMGSLYW